MRMTRAELVARMSLVVCLLVLGITPQSAAPAGNGLVQQSDLREWLGYVASDELQGRQVFTEGLGLAAGYIADHLAAWNVKPAGEDGTYFQTVKVVGVRSTSKASVTVEVNGETRMFKDGEGILFPKRMGGRQTISSDKIQFVGYGLQMPSVGDDDYANLDPAGKIVIFLGPGQKTLPPGSFRLVNARSRNALDKGAVATIGRFRRGSHAAAEILPRRRPLRRPSRRPGIGVRSRRSRRRRRRQRRFHDGRALRRPVTPPLLTANDEFFEFLFSGSEVKYADSRTRSSKQEPLPAFALKGVTITFNVDADYTVVRTQLTRNVVGIVHGTDPKLKDTYVAVRRPLRSHRLHSSVRGQGAGLSAAPSARAARASSATLHARATTSTTAPTTTARERWR